MDHHVADTLVFGFLSRVHACANNACATRWLASRCSFRSGRVIMMTAMSDEDDEDIIGLVMMLCTPVLSVFRSCSSEDHIHIPHTMCEDHKITKDRTRSHYRTTDYRPQTCMRGRVVYYYFTTSTSTSKYKYGGKYGGGFKYGKYGLYLVCVQIR